MYDRNYFVWIEIAGILGLLALLLGPLAYLATQMGGSVVNGGSAIGAGAARSAPSQSGHRTARRPRGARAAARSPGAAARESARPTSGARVPFSEDWREQAAPDLSGRGAVANGSGAATAGLSGAAARGDAGVFAPTAEGGTGPSSGSETGGGGPVASGTETDGRSWIDEAQRLGGQARALSGQLRAMEEAGERRSDGSASSANAPAPGAAKSAADNPGTPDEPTVPIDDHLHWLVVAGVLWGAWRIGRGA